MNQWKPYRCATRSISSLEATKAVLTAIVRVKLANAATAMPKETPLSWVA